ncbi:Molybdate-binding periplasmic protein precursor [Roseivivax sp. THAF30]|nr:Molybdate-binding periplasmic protein precursor [Roseivivax sp. THAF30]
MYGSVSMRLSGFSLLAALACPVMGTAAEITVFAAASTRDVLAEAAEIYSESSGDEIRIAPAGSSVLARQIAQGAPADVFVSANPEWMDWLEERDAVDPETRAALFGNRLVLIAHGAGAAGSAELAPGVDIASRLGPEDRLAVALTDAVPAGIYARAALESLGEWEALAPRLAEADNVRAALALVALGEAPLGIVYATDAAAEMRVRVAGTFPEDSHPPIRYVGAVTAAAAEPEAAAAFLRWLGGPQATEIIARHGFAPLPE